MSRTRGPAVRYFLRYVLTRLFYDLIIRPLFRRGRF